MTTTTNITRTTITNTGFSSRRWISWISVQKAPGMRATIPAKMSIEMPLPMPRLVIWSPIHMRNIVPVVTVSMAMSEKGSMGSVIASGILLAYCVTV